ncbi:hydroxyacid dehydrogenase [Candidatus Shapirobacteria bacterium]|nr:hydroxyacid dehydrogenase [Candidatus Shapirobacteria bacterium]
MKIAFFGVKNWEKKIIEEQITNLENFGIGIFESEVQDDLELAAQYEILSVFIYSRIDKKTLDKLPNLRMIATRSTGFDHIDMDECKKRNIIVETVPVYGSRTVAEYTIGLMLAVAKNIVESDEALQDDEFSPEGLTGIDLYKKTLGIVGLGKIGSNVAKVARAMGMKIVAMDKNPNLKIVKRYKIEMVGLKELLQRSDVVSLHVPAIKETYHLINRDTVKLMKPGSILINTSRGAVVESAAVVWALDKGILRGAGLDVVEEEDKVESLAMILSQQPKKEDLQDLLSYHMLRDRSDVVFTPHNAFNTEEAIGRIIKTTIDNIKNFLKTNQK